MFGVLGHFLGEKSVQTTLLMACVLAGLFLYVEKGVLERNLRKSADSLQEVQRELAQKEVAFSELELKLQKQNQAISELREQEIKREGQAKTKIAELQKRLNALKLPASKDCASELAFYKSLFSFGNDTEAQP